MARDEIKVDKNSGHGEGPADLKVEYTQPCAPASSDLQQREQATDPPDFRSKNLDDKDDIRQQQNFENDGKLAAVDLRGRPVNLLNTGTWKAAIFLYALNAADYQASISVSVNLVPYLATTLHQPISKAATITTNFTGTCSLLSVLGGFIADNYLGSFKTIVGGAVAMSLGLSLLTFSTAYSGLQPAPCTAEPTTSCPPAGTRYMAPLYLALYTIALGTGLVKPNGLALGADQFDESSPKEKKQSVHFFVWFYFSTNVGLLLAFTLGVYLQDNVSRSWGYGFDLMFYMACGSLFFIGAPRLRNKQPAGSFLTRTAQVLVAAVLKRNVPLIPPHTSDLYDPPVPARSLKLSRTDQLRFLDRAAVVDNVNANVHSTAPSKFHHPWRLCSVTQVEETKRILQMIPIWATTAAVSLVFSQLATFTVQQGQTFDRKLRPHFVVPSAALNVFFVVSALLTVPLYDGILVPFVRRFTKHPYGFTTLQRIGASIIFAILTMITAALVERKRLTSVRELQLESLPLGSYVLPLKMWWLLPQFFLSAQVELFLFVASYQFFYHEAAEGTRSIASSFTYSASAMGYYLSTVLVELVNRATRHNQGGSWLEGKLNDGGLEKFYWLLAVLLSVNFLLYIVCSHRYRYKYDWYHHGTSPQVEGQQLQQLPSSEKRVT